MCIRDRRNTDRYFNYAQQHPLSYLGRNGAENQGGGSGGYGYGLSLIHICWGDEMKTLRFLIRDKHITRQDGNTVVAGAVNHYDCLLYTSRCV